MYFSLTAVIFLVSQTFAAPTTTTTGNTSTTSGLAPQKSPYFSNLTVSSEAIHAYNTGKLNVSTTLSTETLDLSTYPTPWTSPDINHPDVQKAIAAINWDLVPDAPVHTTDANGDLVFTGYDGAKDPYCWWSYSNCVTPKVSYLPQDYYLCPTKGQWGLSYDDGPFNLRPAGSKYAATENPYAEPSLYNFLAKENLKATLMYIGSNVVTYPAAARRALSDGHYLCVHTWSHPPMTTQTNEKAVAEFYWALRAVKEATGVTPKCWRPPQGDIDDRIRAIAWQMGLHSVLWNRDTDDWDMPAPGGGNLPPATVDAKFEKWIAQEKAGNQTTGILVLEHELNHATVEMSEHWIPTLKEVFDIVPALGCNGVTEPYWESNFKYPPTNNTSS